MSLHATLRDGTRALFGRIENAFDVPFGPADNPLRHLGAMGFYFFWIIAISGLYLYTVLDTSIDGVYHSIQHFTLEQWLVGGILRSLHRYASDGFVIVMFLHLVREWAFDRYAGFRWYSWITGVPLIWLVFMSGIGGYWIVWDRLAQFSAIASTELLDWLPIFSDPTARNFLTPEAMTDRFFTLLVYVHIGIPLFLVLMLWVHVQRISSIDHFPARKLALGTLATLLLLGIVNPALSDAQANLALVPDSVRIDWLILFIHPLTYATSPAVVWSLAFGVTILLFILPLLPHPKQAPIAVVDAPNCNGCRRCLADCPYAAVTMAPHPDKPHHEIAIVNADNCASCGICVGSCPSSTPFRSAEELVTGIDMPQQPIGALRHELEQTLANLTGHTKIVVFGCAQGADISALQAADTAAFTLICAGMLPPSFVEYALRGGADGVLVTGCREDGCAFRTGTHWTRERLAHRREPHLRPQVPAERVRECWADANGIAQIALALDEFRTHLDALAAGANRPAPYTRRTAHHEA